MIFVESLPPKPARSTCYSDGGSISEDEDYSLNSDSIDLMEEELILPKANIEIVFPKKDNDSVPEEVQWFLPLAGIVSPTRKDKIPTPPSSTTRSSATDADRRRRLRRWNSTERQNKDSIPLAQSGNGRWHDSADLSKSECLPSGAPDALDVSFRSKDSMPSTQSSNMRWAGHDSGDFSNDKSPAYLRPSYQRPLPTKFALDFEQESELRKEEEGRGVVVLA